MRIAKYIALWLGITVTWCVFSTFMKSFFWAHPPAVSYIVDMVAAWVIVLMLFWLYERGKGDGSV
jgi:hypothetical protein